MPNHASVWDTLPVPRDRPRRLPEGPAADVVVVGAGIAGLTTAYCLQRDGRSVLVLDAKPRFAGGESLATTAQLASALDDRFHRLVSLRGADVAGRAHRAHARAIDWIEATVRDEGIACDFRRLPAYLIPGDGQGADEIAKEADACAKAGVPCERRDALPAGVTGSGPCLAFAHQGEFHVLHYLAGLAAAVEKRGGVIAGNCRVTGVTGGDAPSVTLADGTTVTAKTVVLASNIPVNAGAVYSAKFVAYNTYVVALDLPAGAAPDGMVWDTLDPYHYVRTAPHPEPGKVWLIVGGEDHKTGQADDAAERWGRLEAWTRERFPSAGAVGFRWSGEVIETLDGLAHIGADSDRGKNVWHVTGDSGMGMTHGTLAGPLLADLIAGRPNADADLFEPTRWVPMAAKTLAEEGINVAAQYLDWFREGDVASPDAIPPGEGALIRRGLSKVAVYRDPAGAVCELSAVCTHLQGIVQWNRAEKTWDCPCHGARYAASGEVIHGPASEPLKRLAPMG